MTIICTLLLWTNLLYKLGVLVHMIIGTYHNNNIKFFMGYVIISLFCTSGFTPSL